MTNADHVIYCPYCDWQYEDEDEVEVKEAFKDHCELRHGKEKYRACLSVNKVKLDDL